MGPPWALGLAKCLRAVHFCVARRCWLVVLRQTPSGLLLRLGYARAKEVAWVWLHSVQPTKSLLLVWRALFSAKSTIRITSTSCLSSSVYSWPCVHTLLVFSAVDTLVDESTHSSFLFLLTKSAVHPCTRTVRHMKTAVASTPRPATNDDHQWINMVLS